jgi:hypothetical protein
VALGRGFAGEHVKSNNTLMKSNGTLALVQSIYEYVHRALWATLAAFVVFFLAFTVPRLLEIAARAEALRTHEISQQNEDYCLTPTGRLEKRKAMCY